MNRIPLTLLLLFAVATLIKGDPDVPPVPRIKTVTEPMVWTINYQYQEPNPYLSPPTPADAYIYDRMEKENPRFTSSNVIKSGNKKIEITLFDDKSQTIACMVDGIIMEKSRLTNQIQVHKITDWGDSHSGHDFESLDWIDKAEYKGRQEFQGADCYIYYLPPKEELAARTAYINAKTGLPVSVQIDKLTITYTFTPTTQAVELPPDFVVRLKKYQADQKLNASRG